MRSVTPEARAIDDPFLGSALGEHVLEALIGEGTAARVYRARSVATGEMVAIKILSQELGAQTNFVERMRREAVALGRIDHPNVVRTLDFGTTEEGRPYIVMELVRGRTLADLIAERAPFRRRFFAKIARQLASGLAAVHAVGVVHRDLKPANILIGDRGSGGSYPHVKIADFGLARGLTLALGPRESLTDHQSLIGTPLYMAPEQLNNPRDAQPASDIYALGVVFYEMLSGRVPFDGSMMAVFEQHLRREPLPLQSQTGFEGLTLSMLSKSPADRPAQAQVIVDVADLLGESTSEITLNVVPAFELEESTAPELSSSEAATDGAITFRDPTSGGGPSTRILVEEDFAVPLDTPGPDWEPTVASEPPVEETMGEYFIEENDTTLQSVDLPAPVAHPPTVAPAPQMIVARPATRFRPTPPRPARIEVTHASPMTRWLAAIAIVSALGILFIAFKV